MTSTITVFLKFQVLPVMTIIKHCFITAGPATKIIITSHIHFTITLLKLSSFSMFVVSTLMSIIFM